MNHSLIAGADVFLIPTGNHFTRRQSAESQVVRATVVSIKRTRGKFIVNGAHRETGFTVNKENPEYIDVLLNSGYRVFYSEKAISDHFLAERTKSFLRNQSLSVEDLVKIAAVIGVQ
jgi:hypothetical protein